jgi:hypothetical protein
MYLSQCLNISQQKDLELNGINVNNIDCWALWSLLETASTIIHDLKWVWDHGPQGHYHTACPEPLLLARNLKLLWEVNLCGHAGKSPAPHHPADEEKSHSVSYPTGELWGCLRHLHLVKLMQMLHHFGESIMVWFSFILCPYYGVRAFYDLVPILCPWYLPAYLSAHMSIFILGMWTQKLKMYVILKRTQKWQF